MPPTRAKRSASVIRPICTKLPILTEWAAKVSIGSIGPETGGEAEGNGEVMGAVATRGAGMMDSATSLSPAVRSCPSWPPNQSQSTSSR